jgi:hypothetical protein
MGSTFIFRKRYRIGMSVVKRVPKISENYSSLVHSTLKLFKAVPVKTQKTKKPSKAILEETIRHGFVFSKEVAGNYTDEELRQLIPTIATDIGITPEQMNSTFHKSWGKVRDTPLFNLVQEQLFHYMTTYGYEAMGTYDEGSVFIPNERLEIPQLKDGIKLIIIKGYTKKHLKEKLMKILESGIALQSLDEVIEIAKYSEIQEDEIAQIKNKEARIRLYRLMDLLPTIPVEFLRYMIYNTTDKTLIITNKKAIENIKTSETNPTPLFEEYDEVCKNGYSRLAQIFLRYKRLFLAFKAHEGMEPIINTISRLAHKNHKPMKPSFLNDVTGILKRGDVIQTSRLNEELDKVNIWRKIRLAQSLSYRMTKPESIMYKIRNGKAFATTMDFDNIAGARKAYNTILTSIAKDLKHLKGKEFYIPENITYALPATEKQFVGSIPSGTFVTIPDNMIFGVYWENQPLDKEHESVRDESYRGYYGEHDTHGGKRRIDLDLHSMALNAGHVGWNSSYRSENSSVLFSGDITDAPNGATELLYMDKKFDDTILLTLNYYNFDENLPVPFKILVGEEKPIGRFQGRSETPYMINPNNLRCSVKTVIDVKQKVIGLGTVKNGQCRFYFTENALGDKIAVRGGDYISHARRYLADFAVTQITFNEVLELVGAKIVTEPTKDSIDLSLENLETDTFINLLIQ